MACIWFPRDGLVKYHPLDKHHEVIFVYNLEKRLFLLNEGQTMNYLFLLQVVKYEICVLLGFCFP